MSLDDRLSYLTVFSCPLGRYLYTEPPFGPAPAEAVFQKKIDEIFSGMPIVFGIVENILTAVSDEQSKDHYNTF